MTEQYKFISPDPDCQVIPWTQEEIEDHKKWEAKRQELLQHDSLENIRFGSSSVGAIAGVNSYEGVFKAFQIYVGNVTPMKSTIKMSLGHVAEPFIAEAFQYFDYNESIDEQQVNIPERMANKEVRRSVYNANFFLLNSKYPQLLSSIDYLLPKEYGCPITGETLETDAIVEIKNIGYQTYKSWIDQGGVAPYYLSQLTQQQMVSGLKHGYLLALVDNSFLQLFKVDYSSEWVHLIDSSTREMAHKVLAYKNAEKAQEDMVYGSPEWEEIEAFKHSLEPNMDGLESTTDVIKDLYKGDDSETELIGEEQEYAWADRYLQVNDEIKELTTEKTFLKNSLLNFMKRARKMTVLNITVTYKNGRFSVKKNKNK